MLTQTVFIIYCTSLSSLNRFLFYVYFMLTVAPGGNNLVTICYKDFLGLATINMYYYYCYCYYYYYYGQHLLQQPLSKNAVAMKRMFYKNIKTKVHLLKLANEQKNESKRDLPFYVLNNIDKCTKLIQTTWEMENARTLMERQVKARMELLEVYLASDCVPQCNGFFAEAVRCLLDRGRGKHRNLLITRPANCGKTFLLSPLTKVYQSFVNPAQNTFVWVGAERAQIIFLNDLRWTARLIPWRNFL